MSTTYLLALDWLDVISRTRICNEKRKEEMIKLKEKNAQKDITCERGAIKRARAVKKEACCKSACSVRHQYGRTKISHVRREIDEKEGGKRVGEVNGRSFFEHDERVEEMRRVVGARARAKVKYDGPEEIWSDRTARSYESDAEEALAIRASRYSRGFHFAAAAETTDVVT